MKKLLFLLIAIVMCFNMVACGKDSESQQAGSSKNKISVVKTSKSSNSLEAESKSDSDLEISSSAQSSVSKDNTESSVEISGSKNCAQSPSSVNSTSVSVSSASSSSVATSSGKPLTNSAIEVLNKAINSITLYENNTVDRDVIILPRVSHEGIVYISWSSSDPSIIDNLGNVYQNSTTQHCTLTATYDYDGYLMQKNYDVTVLPKKTESGQVTLSDSRIANKVFVSSASELSSAISNASAGTAIVLRNGTYNNVSVKLTKSGTKDNPIFIMAENPLGAKFTGSTLIETTGNYVVIANLLFSDGSPANANGCVMMRGDYSRFTNNKIYNYNKSSGDYKWVSLYGKRAEVDHNVFDGKQMPGTLLCVWRNDDSAQYHHIHDNLFANYASGGGENGWETIRIGDSSKSQSDSFTLVENNVFSACNGEIETISAKSGRNVIRNNTFIETQGHITLRHGKNSLVSGNVFMCNQSKETGAIRFYDGGHVAFNNYIEGQRSTSNTRGAIVVHTGVNAIGEIPALNAQWTAYNCVVDSNTLVDCEQSFHVSGKYSYSPKDITVTNNAFYGSNCAGFRIDKSIVNLTSNNNLAYSKALFTSKSELSEFVGVNLNAYSLPARASNGLVEHQTLGARELVKLSAQDVGNY